MSRHGKLAYNAESKVGAPSVGPEATTAHLRTSVPQVASSPKHSCDILRFFGDTKLSTNDVMDRETKINI